MCKFKLETLKNIYIDEFVGFRWKMYAFKAGDDSKNKLKGLCESKNINFEDYKKRLDGMTIKKLW